MVNNYYSVINEYKATLEQIRSSLLKSNVTEENPQPEILE
jgi:hypothetical protein